MMAHELKVISFLVFVSIRGSCYITAHNISCRALVIELGWISLHLRAVLYALQQQYKKCK